MSTETNQEAVATPEASEGEGTQVQDNAEITEVETLRKQIEEQNATIGTLKRDLKDAKKPKDTPKKTEQEGLDYGAKAFLMQNDVKAEEFGFVEEQLQESGIKDLEKLVKNSYFQSELKARRDKAAVETAMPKGGRITGDSSKTKVDYWMNKGQMPENTPDNMQLRRDIVNKRIELEKNRSRFTSQPVVTGGLSE